MAVKVNPSGETKEGYHWIKRVRNGKEASFWCKDGWGGGSGKALERPVEVAHLAAARVGDMNEKDETESLTDEERQVVESVVTGIPWVDAVRKAYPNDNNRQVYASAARLKKTLMPHVNMLQVMNLDDSETFDVMRERMLRALLINKKTKPNERIQVLKEMAKIRDARRGGDVGTLTQQIEAKTKEMMRLMTIEADVTARGLEPVVDGRI